MKIAKSSSHFCLGPETEVSLRIIEFGPPAGTRECEAKWGQNYLLISSAPVFPASAGDNRQRRRDYLAATMMAPSIAATSVVTIRNVRRENRLIGSQGIVARAPNTPIENQSGMNNVQLVGVPG